MRSAHCKRAFSTAVHDGKSICQLATFIISVTLALCLAMPMKAQTTVFYQPTPRPDNVTVGVNIIDGWVPSAFYGRTFQLDERCQPGGWGDIYRCYIQFDTGGLPQVVTSAKLRLRAFNRGDSSTPVGMDLYRPTQPWSSSMDWDHQPNATLVRSLPAPTPGEWYDIDVTDLYRGWTSGAIQNYGIRLDPHFVSNRFNMFRSSRYTEDAYRPLLELKFAPPVSIPEFKMPLPSDAAWLVTTEVGGFDCIGPRSNGLAYPNPTHAGSKYFAIDFGWDNIDASRKRLFPKPSAGGEIPVLAAAGGRAIVPRDGGPNSPNGYHVILDHDGDGDVGTGFQTWYVHLAAPPTVYHEQEVEQGQRLGLMGSTGRDANGRPTSTDDHLHFAVKYRNRGDAPELAYVVLDSLLLKSYQTECAGGTYSRYYLSSNHEARAGALPIPKFTFSGDGQTGSSGQTVPFSVAHGGTIRITFSGGSDQSGVSYAWTINGSAVSTSASFSRNFGVGNYTVVLKVTNSAGLTGTTSAIVGVR
jgi:hypothetical protein